MSTLRSRELALALGLAAGAVLFGVSCLGESDPETQPLGAPRSAQAQLLPARLGPGAEGQAPAETSNVAPQHDAAAPQRNPDEGTSEEAREHRASRSAGAAARRSLSPPPAADEVPERQVLVQVCDADGRPFPGASFALVPSKRGIGSDRFRPIQFEPKPPWGPRRYRADAAGQLRVRLPHTGTRWLVDRTQHPLAGSSFVIPSGTALEVLPGAEHATLVFTRRAQLTLQFSGREAPQEGDWLELHSDAGMARHLVGEGARLTLAPEPGMFLGELVHTRSGRSWDLRLELEPGAPKTLKLHTSHPAVVISGVVTYERGGPVAGVLVRPARWGPPPVSPFPAGSSRAPPDAGARTDAAGRFTLVCDRAPRALRITAAGYLPLEVDAAAHLTLTLQRAGPLRRLEVEFARPPRLTSVVCVDCTDPPVSRNLTIFGDTSAVFEDLPPGRYRVTVYDGRTKDPDAHWVDVGPDEPVVTLHLP